MSESETHSAIRATFCIESARLIAALTRVVRDVGLAEELAQDALLAALEQWPTSGVPREPGAWLMAAAKHRAINHFRRQKMLAQKHDELGSLQTNLAPDVVEQLEAALDDDVGDDLLRLVFTACHPILSTEGRVALTLRLLAGLTVPEIASAFLVSEPTVAQRIVRAKRALAEANVAFEVPRREELAARLSSVLEVVYLIFNEGYAASAGDHHMRPTLCDDALRLGRTLGELLPEEPEVHGLCALMELHASRARARVAADGAPVLLLEQDRALWDPLFIQRGLRALGRAETLGGREGWYVLQAAISANHALARTAADTNWTRIAELYGRLGALAPSPVVELNRAVAVGMAFGPAAGLELVDALAQAPALKNYHLLPSARADLLAKLGRHGEASAEFERAATLSGNARDRSLLLARARASAAARDDEEL